MKKYIITLISIVVLVAVIVGIIVIKNNNDKKDSSKESTTNNSLVNNSTEEPIAEPKENEYIGTYKSKYGETKTICESKTTGNLYIKGDIDQYFDLNKKASDGSIKILDSSDDNAPSLVKIALYPVGVELSVEDTEKLLETGEMSLIETDSSKIRLLYQGDGIGTTTVYYKVED